MKIKHLILGFLTVTMLFAGCKKEEPAPQEASMTLTPDSLSFAIAPTTGQTVVVNSTREWRADNIPDWITVSINGQSIAGIVQSVGEKTVTIECAENTDVERSAQIIFNGGSIANKTLTVKQEGKPVVYNTIAELKALLGKEESVTIPEDFVIKATVVSNYTLENQTSSKNMTIQDATAGIAVRLVNNCTFNFGDIAIVDLSGQILSKFNGAFQLSNIPNTVFEVVEQSTAVEPIKASFTDFLANKYECQYISIDDVQVADSDLSKTWGDPNGSSHVSIKMVEKGGEGFVVFSSKYSTFKAETVAQGSGTICGVSTINNSTIQLMFSQTSDYAGLTGQRFEIKSQTMAIDDIFAKGKTSGSVEIEARVICKGAKGIILNDGGDKNIYAYTGSAPTASVDDIVKVSGDLTKYNEVVEFTSNGLKIESSSKSIPATPVQTAVDLTDPAAVEAYVSDNSSKLVKIAGELTKSGNYYNMSMKGITLLGSVEHPNTQELGKFVGKKIIITGYFIGKSTKYFTVIPTKIEEDTEPFISLSPASQKVNYNDTTATIAVNTNVEKYTVTASEGATATVDNNVITVTFPKNASYKDVVTYTVTASATGLSDETATITQGLAPDPESKVSYLTNKEIVDGLQATYDSSKKTGYQDATITSASGTWKGNVNIGVKDGTVNSPFIQIRAKSGAYLQSPVFDTNIQKVKLHLSADKNKDQVRTLYAIPTSTTLPTSDYKASDFATNYGSVASTGTPDETVTIDFTGATTSFTIVVIGGASYIDDIEIIRSK